MLDVMIWWFSNKTPATCSSCCQAALQCTSSCACVATRKQLHWLPVSSRIQYKLCTIVFDVQHRRAPEYITDLCIPCQDSRLRSAARGNFQVRGTDLKLTTAGAFSVAGPRHYNTLPTSLRQAGSHATFCSKLKTRFFNLSYNVRN